MFYKIRELCTSGVPKSPTLRPSRSIQFVNILEKDMNCFGRPSSFHLLDY